MDSAIHVEGVEQETVAVAVRLGRADFERLLADGVPCKSIWLTGQPDGSFALGVVTAEPPEALGLRARAVEVDDRAQRFGRSAGHPASAELRRHLAAMRQFRQQSLDAGLDTTYVDQSIEWARRNIALAEGRPYVSESDGPPSIDTLEGLRYLLAVRAAQTAVLVGLLVMRGPDVSDEETLAVLSRLSAACGEVGEIVERKDWANEDGD